MAERGIRLLISRRMGQDFTTIKVSPHICRSLQEGPLARTPSVRTSISYKVRRWDYPTVRMFGSEKVWQSTVRRSSSEKRRSNKVRQQEGLSARTTPATAAISQLRSAKPLTMTICSKIDMWWHPLPFPHENLHTRHTKYQVSSTVPYKQPVSLIPTNFCVEKGIITCVSYSIYPQPILCFYVSSKRKSSYM